MTKYISILIGLNFLAILGKAQDVHQLEDIIISGNRIETPFSEENRSIQVISKHEIELSPVNSVAELLQYAAGIDIRQRGAHGVQADISIRGGVFDQALILLNGVKLYDPQTGHHTMNLPVSLENIERIEVLKGPGARVYGQNAFAGAINIITKVSENDGFGIALQAGDFGLGGVQLDATLHSDKVGHVVSFSKDFSSGYRFNTDYNIDNLFYQGERELGGGKLTWMGGYSQRDFGANGFYGQPRSPAFKNQYEKIQTSIVSVGYKKKKGNFSFQPRIYWRRNQDEYIFSRYEPLIYRNLHLSQLVSAEMNNTWVNGLGKLGFGVELGFVQLFSNNLGVHERFQSGLFVEQRLQLMDNKLAVTPGFFLNYFSDFGLQFYPGLDIGYQATSSLRLFADVGRTNRIPTFTDLYYEDRANLGNANLIPESAIAYEAGIKYQPNNQFSSSISYFQRDGSDVIDWTKAKEEDKWQPFNFSQVSASGVELMLNYRQPMDGIITIKMAQLGYTYLNMKISDEELAPVFSRYALDNLKHQVVGNLTLGFGKKWEVTLGGRWLDRVELENYYVVDGRLGLNLGKTKFHLKATNLLNEEYTETNGVPLPGSWVSGGISYRFVKN